MYTTQSSRARTDRKPVTPVRIAIGVVLASALIAAVAACAPTSDAELVPRSTMFIGVDVSGSFQKGGRYDDAMTFASHYIHAHLNGDGGLEQPRALFVGAIGGEKPGEPQAFHPIHDFEGKSPEEIEADLRDWFAPDDRFTDFNAFFRRAATLVKRQNLALAPITLVLFTDGVPDVGAGQKPADEAERYERIDLDPLEYLARNVTVRLLYPDPTVAVNWERHVPRDRVRMWTVDAIVMEGWREQFRTAADVDPRSAVRHVASSDYGAMQPSREAEPSEGAPADAERAADAGSEDGAEAGPPPVDGGGLQAAREAAAREAQKAALLPVEQSDLWRWIEDNVDYRVRRSVL